jgi:hypothetical protein
VIRRIAKGFATTAGLAGMITILAGSSCDEGVGDPCTPEQEYNADFLGFDEKEVNVESKSFQCRTRLCLVNHFRGRVSCPYGQTQSGDQPPGEVGNSCKDGDNGPAKGCCIPGDPTKAIKGDVDSTGAFIDPRKQNQVSPQCVDRATDKAVYCSCRCADINGDKPSNQTFCDCPDGYQCTRLVTSIGGGVAEGLTGSYCIKSGTQYDPTTACTQGDCNPVDKTHPCP